MCKIAMHQLPPLTNSTSLLRVPVIPFTACACHILASGECAVLLCVLLPCLSVVLCCLAQFVLYYVFLPTPPLFPLRVPVAPPTIMYYGMTIRSQPTNSSVSPTSCVTRTSAVPEVSPTLLRHTMLTWWPSELDTTCKRERIRGILWQSF